MRLLRLPEPPWASRATPGPGLGSTSVEEGVDEPVGVEGDQIVGSLTDADQLDREAELALDRHHDARPWPSRRAW